MVAGRACAAGAGAAGGGRVNQGGRVTGGGLADPGVADIGEPVAAGGRAALALKGPGGARCMLTTAQLRELQALLDAGPAACGWDEEPRANPAADGQWLAAARTHPAALGHRTCGVRVFVSSLSWLI